MLAANSAVKLFRKFLLLEHLEKNINKKSSENFDRSLNNDNLSLKKNITIYVCYIFDTYIRVSHVDPT